MKTVTTTTQTATRKVFVVDDDEDARSGLDRFLRSCGYETECFPSAAAFLDRLPVDTVACVILDLQMPEMSGTELQDELLQQKCDIPIVFLTAHAEVPVSVRAIKQGAEDFLAKMADESDLLDAVERALRRSEKNHAQQQEHAGTIAAAGELSDRERQVCEFVIAGCMNKTIGTKLGIALRTVKAHRANVMSKMGVDSVADLVRVASLAGIQPAEK